MLILYFCFHFENFKRSFHNRGARRRMEIIRRPKALFRRMKPIEFDGQRTDDKKSFQHFRQHWIQHFSVRAGCVYGHGHGGS